MAKILVTIYFDTEEHLELGNRDYDRFIVEAEEHNFRERVFDVLEQKRYAWDDFEKIRQGYKAIMSTVTSDLSELEIFDNEYFTKTRESKQTGLELSQEPDPESSPEPSESEDEWAPEL